MVLISFSKNCLQVLLRQSLQHGILLLFALSDVSADWDLFALLPVCLAGLLLHEGLACCLLVTDDVRCWVLFIFLLTSKVFGLFYLLF